jgi:hypothetical protein
MGLPETQDVRQLSHEFLAPVQSDPTPVGTFWLTARPGYDPALARLRRAFCTAPASNVE